MKTKGNVFEFYKKSNKGITLVALVVTIIILIILAGISINLTLGKNGIITIAKQAKENYELSVIDEDTQLNEINLYLSGNDKIISNKEPIYYVGTLNVITGNNGVVNSKFDIKEIYEDYKDLTVDNFVYQIEKMYDHWNVNPGIIGGKTLVKSYDQENGILSINNAYQVSGFNSGILGKVYLVPDIDKYMNNVQIENYANNKSEYEIYYIGSLNNITGNNGVVNSEFDIKEIYEDYKDLTVDNFVYQIEKMCDHWNVNPGIIGGKTLVKSYDQENGILSINNAYQVDAFNSGILGEVFLIIDINNLISN